MSFILNHQQHWFALRRFGALEDPENGHWFNLNSFLKEPEWVGKLYLGMVLSQAEDEGEVVGLSVSCLPKEPFQDTPFFPCCPLAKLPMDRQHYHELKRTR